MALFQARLRQIHVHDKKIRRYILGDLNKLKDSILSSAGKESADMLQSQPPEFDKAPQPPSTCSLIKEPDTEKHKPRVGIKRPHSDPHFGQPLSKIPCVSLTVDSNQPEIIDLTIASEEDVKPTSKPGCSIRNVAEVGGVTGKNTRKIPTISPSDKNVGGYSPSVDKQPTRPMVLEKQGLPTTDSVRSTKAVRKRKKLTTATKSTQELIEQPPTPSTAVPPPSDKTVAGYVSTIGEQATNLTTMKTQWLPTTEPTKESRVGIKAKLKQPLKRPVNQPPATSSVDPASDMTVAGYHGVSTIDKLATSLSTVKTQGLPTMESTKESKIGSKIKFKQAKQLHASSNVAVSKSRARSKKLKPVIKRVRKSRCNETVKKYCRVCSKPDCEKCKNCL